MVPCAAWHAAAYYNTPTTIARALEDQVAAALLLLPWCPVERRRFSLQSELLP